MATRNLTILLFILLSILHASAQIESEITTTQREVLKGNYEAIEKLRMIDVRETLPTLRKYALSEKNDQVSSKAIEILRSKSGIELMLAEEIRENMKSGYANPLIWEDFKLLAKLNTADSARQIGPFLFDDAILKSGMDDVADGVASAYAAMSLQQFGLPDGPTYGNAKRGVGAADIQNWRAWWRENESRIDELMKEAKGPPIFHGRAVAESRTSSSPGESVPKSLASPSPVATTEAKQSPVSFPIVPLAILTVAIVGVIVFLVKRKGA